MEGTRNTRVVVNHVYKKLSGVLAKEGVRKSGEQCRTKAKKQRQDYKKIKDKHDLNGWGRVTWKLYEPLNEILGTQPATRPAVVLDTLEPAFLGAKENEERSDEDESGSSPVIIEDNNAIDLNETQESVSHSRSTTPESSTTVKETKGRGRREK